MRRGLRQQGVTLIELMVTIAVLAVLVTLAAPSFAEFRERQALRGAADNLVAAIGLAKEEAVKRDCPVRVTVPEDTAQMTAVLEDCTCPDDDCTVVRFPDQASDLRQVTLSGEFDFLIDPKTATLTDLAAVESGVTFETRHEYQAAVMINALARPRVCTPDGATKSLPGVAAC